MVKDKITETENYRLLREQAGMTLSQLSSISGYSIAAINGLENNGEGSKRLKAKLLSILLQKGEESDSFTVDYWKNRALQSEQKFQIAIKTLETTLRELKRVN